MNLYLQLDDIEEELDEIYTDSSTFLKVSIVIVHIYLRTVISVRYHYIKIKLSMVVKYKVQSSR
jgi:hypothetical protein